MKYRGYEVGDDEETEGKKDGVDAILADKEGKTCYNPNPCPRKTMYNTCDPFYNNRYPTLCSYLNPKCSFCGRVHEFCSCAKLGVNV